MLLIISFKPQVSNIELVLVASRNSLLPMHRQTRAWRQITSGCEIDNQSQSHSFTDTSQGLDCRIDVQAVFDARQGRAGHTRLFTKVSQ